MLRLKILTLITTIAAVFIFINEYQIKSTFSPEQAVTPAEWHEIKKEPATPAKFVRPADQTFLTYPEWFLVHSPAEQADFFQTRTPTYFPYRGHISQLWKSYGVVYDEIKASYAFNTGYHVMIWVIGVSTTVEYAVKDLYESTVGRATDPGPEKPLTEEDQFNAEYMQEYVDFIRVDPWYKFDFKEQLNELWATTSLFGDNNIRKWERKYWLTSELLIKWGYGWLIGLGTETAYEEAAPTTAVLADKLPEKNRYKIVKQYSDNSVLLLLPRYEAFSGAVCELADQGIHFKEIAGNSGAILITIVAPEEWSFKSQHHMSIFTQPILTKKKLHRVAIVTSVQQLSHTLLQLKEEPVKIEHIYDY